MSDFTARFPTDVPILEAAGVATYEVKGVNEFPKLFGNPGGIAALVHEQFWPAFYTLHCLLHDPDNHQLASSFQPYLTRTVSGIPAAVADKGREYFTQIDEERRCGNKFILARSGSLGQMSAAARVQYYLMTPTARYPRGREAEARKFRHLLGCANNDNAWKVTLHRLRQDRKNINETISSESAFGRFVESISFHVLNRRIVVPIAPDDDEGYSPRQAVTGPVTAAAQV